MKVPVNWLKEYVDFDLSVEKLADKLTLSGSEVDQILGSADFKNIVVGEILEIKKHPDADKLHVCQIDVGETKPRQIICGSLFIVEPGNKVPVALAPTKVGDLKVDKAKLRGVESFGMICSDEELGIGGGGLTFFDKKTKNGTNINDIFGRDAVLDIDLTPNRTDCFSMVGMARETAATLETKLKIVEPRPAKVSSDKKIKVLVKEKNLCPHYIAKIIEDVKIAPSPEWVQRRLLAAGVRPINNIVDVTNYVMLEWGQPLHAFDADKITGDEIIVRKAKKGERMETLDGVMRTFEDRDLLIADSVGPIAVAGVMGGAASEVSSSTKNIVLESANFEAVSIRKTAQRLALRSESSTRFEKGLPSRLQEIAIERAAELILDLAGGKVGSNVENTTRKDEVKTIKMDVQKFERFSGIQISDKQAVSILSSLGFECKKEANLITAKVPWWRLDISIPQDLYEEVARIYGYNNMPSTLPGGELPTPEGDPKLEMISKIKEVLIGAGFSEVINYSFTSKKVVDFLGENDKALKITNPISPEWEYMRTDLSGSLLGNIQTNQDNYNKIRLFEIGNIYIKNRNLSSERTLLGIILNSKKEDSFLLLKGIFDLLSNKLNIKLDLEEATVGLMETGRSAHIITQRGQNIGWIGEVNIKTKGFFGIKDNAAMIQVDINLLRKEYGRIKIYKPFPKFPASERDLTFVVADVVKVLDIEQVIDSMPSKIRTKREVIDIYRGKGLGTGKKAVTVRFTYQSEERTLEEKEIDQDQKDVIKKIETKLGGKVRGGKAD